MTAEATTAARVPADETTAGARSRRVITSGALFADRQEIVIVHRGDEYRLRITKTGKLILTK